MLLTCPSRCISGVDGEEELLLLLEAEVLLEASSAGRRREAARAAGMVVQTEQLIVDGSKMQRRALPVEDQAVDIRRMLTKDTKELDVMDVGSS